MKQLLRNAVLCTGLWVAAPAVLAEGVVTDDGKIRNAMSAAPGAISANAGIWDHPAASGELPPVLRPGTNGWTCFPDNPATPGNDPVCLDRQGLEWMNARLARRTPNITGSGLAYMLQGGSEPGNADPFAAQPASGQGWLDLPPHLVLLGPQPWDRALFPVEMNAASSGPWVMFANTPFEHLRVPLPANR
ncbi:MAG: hypothetical protein K0R03_1214 [Moraxellaceae bacterium]|jgi:hypothetical protein|nr:hypothetical protein [Moraxellaceae bacterium]